jgi:DNA-binding beta-propeller fold protein YncE
MPPGPPLPDLQDPCGLSVNSAGAVYVANYYRHSIHALILPPPVPPRPQPEVTYLPLIANVDPLDGPCGLDLDASGRLYVNNYHRNVERYPPSGEDFGPPTVIDSSHPTGVAVDFATGNVYVDVRTHLTAYDSSGAPLMDGGEPLKIGAGSLGDGYGLAISRFPATAGRLYVPDHSDDRVKVYDPVLDLDNPVQTITGPPGGFGSLRDSAVAVDRVTGEIYVADTRAHPQYSERPEATIYVFDSLGTYMGRLKYNVTDGSPPGLAVDNSTGIKQGRVYVTSGNTFEASVYAYPRGSATDQSGPSAFPLALIPSGGGEGSIGSRVEEIDCSTACEVQARSGARIPLTAVPGPGSVFAGWSGAGCSGTGECMIEMTEARSVGAEFRALSGPPAPSGFDPGASSAAADEGPLASTFVGADMGTLRVAGSDRFAPRRRSNRRKCARRTGHRPTEVRQRRCDPGSDGQGGRRAEAGRNTCRRGC